MTQVLQSFFSEITDIVYPNNCAVCNQFVTESHNCICKRCFSKFEPTWLEEWKDKLLFSNGIDEVYSAWFKTGSLSDIIHSVKYDKQPKLGMELGRRMSQEFPIEELGEIDLITAIPLNSARIRESGYNQAEWIAKGLSKTWKVPYNFDLIKRIKYTNTQTDHPGKDRIENMKEAFKSLDKIDSLSIAIVDDVITTGATMSECAKVLKKNGAIKIIGVSCCTPAFNF